MKNFWCAALSLLICQLSVAVMAQKVDKSLGVDRPEPSERISLWEGPVPGFAEDFQHQEMVQLDAEHVSEVTRDTISVFPAAKPHENRASVVIFPGGAYRVLADLKEGDRVAAYLAEQGFTCFVVRYRVSKEFGREAFQFPGPLYDARQAIRFLKANAEKFNIDPDKLGVMGFSAGGHLASMAMTRYQDELEGEMVSETAKDMSLRPAFGALIYPVATMVGAEAHGTSRKVLFGDSPSEKELEAASAAFRLDADSPSMFLVHTEFDPVSSLATLELAVAARKAKVGCELHIYPMSDHGYGMGRKNRTEQDSPVNAWPELLVKFLKRQ